MTPEQAQDPEFLEHLEKTYKETMTFLSSLNPEAKAEVYREALLAMTGHLANFAGENAEAQYKSLFNGAIKTGIERVETIGKE